MTRYRIESDSMGELQVPEDACYGAQTQRAILNFPVSGLSMPRSFLNALGLMKQSCARANRDLGAMDDAVCDAIVAVCDGVINGALDDQFPVDIFQTGSGTSTNMNANEVIAHLASQRGSIAVHPNDHVNMSQSSNDVIPSCIHVSAAVSCAYDLIPSLDHLHTIIDKKAETVVYVVTTGRTHLMDAMPVTLAQELSGWSAQVASGIARIKHASEGMQKLAIGGTAVGTCLLYTSDAADELT